MRSDPGRSWTATPRRAWRRWLGCAVTFAATAVAVVLLRASLPDPGTMLRALADAGWWWLVAALILEAGSVLMYADQQRRLLTAFGGAMSTGRAVGVSLARTALSTAMPAGGPVSTAFAVRQFRVHGLTGAAALATTALASVQASGAIVLVYLAWSVIGLLADVSVTGLLATATAGALLCAAGALLGHVVGTPRPAALLRHLLRNPRRAGPLRHLAHRPRSAWHRPPTVPRPEHLPAAPLIRGFRALLLLGTDTARACRSLPGRCWLTAGGAALARRLCDLACFVAVAHAYRLDAGVMALVGAYLTGQLVRQIPLVAGGAGLVEASLLASLVVSGTEDTGAAAAVVLTYRLLSCWLVAIAGLPVVIGLGAGRRGTGAGPDPVAHRMLTARPVQAGAGG